jgi:uncharacterized protein (TIGR02246 family)
MQKYFPIRIALVFVLCLGVDAVMAQNVLPTGKATPTKAEVQARQATVKAAESKTDDQGAQQAAEALTAAFNRGKASEVAALFLPDAELTDDAGNLHKGRKEIEEVMRRFFERFPGAQLQQQITSNRPLSTSLAIQEGVQTIVSKDGTEKSDNHFTAVLMHQEGGWTFATFQQNPDEREPAPHKRLEPLSWIVGDWVDEGSDDVVAISCKWSEEKNFLLVNYESKIHGKEGIKSSQRIGWDPLAQQIHSWVFDTDGGYGEGRWTSVDGSWIIKSTAVMPDGQTGSATLVLEPAGKDKFVMKGLDRIVGDDTQSDFQVTIVRKPPQPSK